MPNLVRPPALLALDDIPAQAAGGLTHRTVRARNFAVTWLDASAAGASDETASADELMLIILDAPCMVSPAAGGTATEVAARSIAILPAGRWRLQPRAGGRTIVLRSLRDGARAGAFNEADFAQPDPQVAPVGKPYRPRAGADAVRILPIEAVQASKDRPRLKMVQSATLSINWVEYQGPRDRTALSPHAHADFEQGSLAVAGEFVHHLRVEWGANADLWQDDRHARLGSPSLLVVPPGLIHTSEGVGPGHHILVDIFSPPRADFIANGWVFNANDYSPPQ